MDTGGADSADRGGRLRLGRADGLELAERCIDGLGLKRWATATEGGDKVTGDGGADGRAGTSEG